MKGELLKAQAFLTDKERGSLMRNYRQIIQKQIYQIYALKKAGLYQIESLQSLVSIGYSNTLRMFHDCSKIVEVVGSDKKTEPVMTPP